MPFRPWSRFTHWVERKLVQGAQYRLLLAAALVGLISVIGGGAVLAVGSGFTGIGEAVWWAFLRLSDPGYLGDDVGTVNRTVSTALTVLGYVVFLGALVAIMTQWLNARMERLESGLTPVVRNDHVLVLGWTNRTDAVVRELLLSRDRVRRFLRRHGTRSLHIVVLAEEVNATVAQDLRDAVGAAWQEEDVTLRSGTPLRTEHLTRVDHLNASVIILPASDFQTGGVSRSDSHTVKTLLSLRGDVTDRGAARAASDDSVPPDLPLVVAEIFDARKISVARKAYPGPLKIVASDAIISRLLAQNVRHPGLSHVYNELLTHEGGSELYLREHPELEGRRFEELHERFDSSIPMGVVRPGPGSGHTPHLNPPPDFRVRAGDRFVHLAFNYDGTGSTAGTGEGAWPRGTPGMEELEGIERRVLILGWNHKVPALIREFDTYERERLQIRVLSTVDPPHRRRALERQLDRVDRVTVEHVEGDYAEIRDIEAVDPGSHDAILVVGSDRLRGEEESDARTIMGSLVLREMGFPRPGTQTILELLDPENVRLLDGGRGEVIISPLVVSHMLAHVALRPELGTVFEELFTAGGAEITFEPLEDYLPASHEGHDVSFGEVRRAAHARGEIALGIRGGPRAVDVELNPSDSRRQAPGTGVQVVTLVTYL